MVYLIVQPETYSGQVYLIVQPETWNRGHGCRIFYGGKYEIRDVAAGKRDGIVLPLSQIIKPVPDGAGEGADFGQRRQTIRHTRSS